MLTVFADQFLTTAHLVPEASFLQHVRNAILIFLLIVFVIGGVVGGFIGYWIGKASSR